MCFFSFTENPPESNMVETTQCYQGRGRGYKGTVDMTPTGLTCQRWDSQHPHNHTFFPQAYPCKWVRHSHKTTAHSLSHLHALKSAVNNLDFLCVFQGLERKLLSQSRWPRIPLVLHYGPQSPHNVLQQHPSVRHPDKPCQWWVTQQFYPTLRTARGESLCSTSEAKQHSAFSKFVEFTWDLVTTHII